MKVAPVAKRTFYLERNGTQYTLVKVWEPGESVPIEEIQKYVLNRVMSTRADERIMAEQSVSIRQGQRGIEIEAAPQTVEQATKIAELTLGNNVVKKTGES